MSLGKQDVYLLSRTTLVNDDPNIILIAFIIIVIIYYISEGDKLNFGMALEKANAEGLNVKMVVVADDCALPIGKGTSRQSSCIIMIICTC